MEQTLKDLIGRSYYLIDPAEHLLNKIEADCMRLLKYKPLFNDESDCENYEERIHNILSLLIFRCKFFLFNYYTEKIDNLRSKNNNTSANAKTEETVESVETGEEETDEES